MTEESDLPQAPPALVDLLRRLDSRLNELDDLRQEVRAMRELLEAPQPRDGVVSAATIHAIASISAGGRVEPPASGTASGTLSWQGHAEGHAPTIDDQPTREWLRTLKRRGGQTAKAADVITRIVYLATKLGEHL